MVVLLSWKSWDFVVVGKPKCLSWVIFFITKNILKCYDTFCENDFIQSLLCILTINAISYAYLRTFTFCCSDAGRELDALQSDCKAWKRVEPSRFRLLLGLQGQWSCRSEMIVKTPYQQELSQHTEHAFTIAWNKCFPHQKVHLMFAWVLLCVLPSSMYDHILV